MPLPDWPRSPRHPLGVFLLLTLLPSALLMAFGWRLVRQDHAIEIRQLEDGRQQAADLIVAALAQQVESEESALRQDLAGGTVPPRSGAVRLILQGARTLALSRDPLPFHPVARPGTEAPEGTFHEADRREFAGDPAGAEAINRRLADGPAPVRAAALIRLARLQRKQQRIDDALRTFARAAELRDASVSGIPVSLLAAWARCDLLERSGRDTELRTEAANLSRQLLAGAWPLDRPQFEAHISDALRWAGHAAMPDTARPLVSIAHAVATTYEQLRTTESQPPTRATVSHDGKTYAVLTQRSGDRTVTLIAGPAYVRDVWLANVTPLADRHGLRVSLGEKAGGPLARGTGAAGLPWALTFEPIDARVPGVFDGRRAWWLGAFGCMLLVIASATYAVGRAVARELAVARLQNDFVAAVSHEFRTPLTSLRQITEMLLERPHEPERARSYYEMLARQTSRLHRFVENLLDFGRMQAGTSPYRFEPLDAVALVSDVVAQFEGDVASRGHAVSLDAPETAAISGDADAVARALWNLLDNAAKYSPQANRIWVTVTLDEGVVSIRVRDEGAGIPTSEQREIFGKFVRGASARESGIAGTGIGLAMARHIAAAHGGDISVRSQEGRGSTFTLSIPAAIAATERHTEAAWLES